ncbi:arylesterase [Alkalilimnicola sp. S0819]|uniref:arylesterase n=1 Tax=Alkalilimnicola sp. S0819 TaxID=2613922 RepID=UPI001262616D|nr:arylesterase [Alkalilimnicola sp. S0819]KAB7627664.1 arylesterase [Alkalilimnicola sp. S0819]MPQ15831.1 arylesterase [Alkalilimnicola sp. S0819]
MSRWLLLALLWTVSPGAAAEAVILVMGDSLSAGYGVPRESRWTALLEQRLRERGLAYRVVNAAITGDTTRGGLSRLPQALARHEPNILVIALGGNDGLRAIPAREMRENLSRMVALGREAGAKVLLVGVRLPPNYGAAFTRLFAESYRQVAHETGAPLVPRILDKVGERPELMQDDGIHPNEDAQPLILDNIWEGLRPLLDDT